MKYVIFNADDAGGKPDITQGIVDSFYEGVLRSATVLVNHIHPSDIDILKKASGLGLGLHTNVATGEPISDIWRSTYGNFVFSDPTSNRKDTNSYTQGDWEKVFGNYEIAIVVQELEAQVEYFEELFGVLPTHLDSHYNTYAVEPVFEAYMVVAQKYGLPVRLPVLYQGTVGKLEDKELDVSHARIDDLRELGIETTDDLYLEYLNLQSNYVDAILYKVEQMEEGSVLEIPVHPGYTTLLREEWKKRYVDILKDPDLAEALESNNIKSISYGELSEIRNA
jgi:chitin disaccharide deacetylase